MSDALDQDGPAAPPRSNGELVFEAPWETRSFGLAVALREAGVFDWEDFRALLIQEIDAWERSDPRERGEFVYYRHWQCALERVLDAKRLCPDEKLLARIAELGRRPHGHDH